MVLMIKHVSYPHAGDGDLYDCPACEVIMADKCEEFTADNCFVCGEPWQYCSGHGEIGDPEGFRVVIAHNKGDHSGCVS